MRFRQSILAASLFTASAAAAQQPLPAPSRSVPSVKASRRNGDIKIDGKLDESAWAGAEASSETFTQSYPQPGKAPTKRTEIRVLYDDDALYVAVKAFDDHPDSIAAPLARRDGSGIYSDWIHLIVDSYHDRRNGFRFSVNPKGVQKDVYQGSDGEDINWDAVWEVQTSIDAQGWNAEYRIPFSQLRFASVPKGEERIWGFQLQRDIARDNERTTWSPWTPQDPNYVAMFGDLTGIVDIPTPSRAELLPYVSTRLTRAPGEPSNPFFKHNALKPNFGADFKAGLPAGLTVTGTINPDFGQVEVDPAVINLSAFETFFPEKRPFFIEGSQLFNFGQVRTFNNYGSKLFFYSRRIGKEPSRFLGPSEANFVDAPEQATILGAAKVSGRLGQWSLGVLDAVTDEEQAKLITPANVEGKAIIEPRTNYVVGRLRRDFRAGNSTIGAILTNTRRDLSDPTLADFLHKNATVGGIDFEHSWKNREWTTSGYLAGSRVEGTANAIAGTQLAPTRSYQRPDAGHVEFDPTRTSLDGYTAEVALQRNGPWFSSLGYKRVTPGLELNDIGFMGRTDFQALSALVGYQSFQSTKHVRDWSSVLFWNGATNLDTTTIFNAWGANASMTLNSFWSGYVNSSYELPELSDALTRGGPIAGLPGSWTVATGMTSDTRRVIYTSVDGSVSGDDFDGWGRSISASVSYRPTTSLRITAGPSISGTKSKTQYVRRATDALATGTYGARYIFGELHQTVVSADTRVDWTFSPTVSFTLYANPFTSAVRFAAFRELLQGGTSDYGTFGVDHGTVTRDPTTRAVTLDPDGSGSAPAIALGNPDFNDRSLGGNAVLRWEYRPGSTLFFVWQQARSERVRLGDFDYNRDLKAIVGPVPTNVFLVKASYWFSK